MEELPNLNHADCFFLPCEGPVHLQASARRERECFHRRRDFQV